MRCCWRASIDVIGVEIGADEATVWGAECWVAEPSLASFLEFLISWDSGYSVP